MRGEQAREVQCQCQGCLDMFGLGVVYRRGEIELEGSASVRVEMVGGQTVLRHRCGGRVRVFWSSLGGQMFRPSASVDPLAGLVAVGGG